MACTKSSSPSPCLWGHSWSFLGGQLSLASRKLSLGYMFPWLRKVFLTSTLRPSWWLVLPLPASDLQSGMRGDRGRQKSASQGRE